MNTLARLNISSAILALFEKPLLDRSEISIKRCLLMIILLLQLLSFTADASKIIMAGDGSCFDMMVKSVSMDDNGNFDIITSGAQFVFAHNVLSIAQNLNSHRKIAVLKFEKKDSFICIENQKDHVLLKGHNFDICIYGDSTCILKPVKKAEIAIAGNFKPDYTGRYQGEVIMIDDRGGIGMYTDHNNKQYEMVFTDENSSFWKAKYHLEKNERIMLAVFPGKHFNLEKSFKMNIVFAQAMSGVKHGLMPHDKVIKEWAKHFNILVIWHKGLYLNKNPETTYVGPYLVSNPVELPRAVKTAHQAGMKVVLYTSFYYHFQKFKNVERYYNEIADLKNTFNIDGVYIDGMLFGTSGHEKDQIFVNYEMIRRLRQLFNAEGVIIYHGTSFGSDVSTMPNVDSYCDATLNGENVAFESFEDAYVKYQVRKFGISNTVALWKPGPHPEHIDNKAIIDAVLGMNGRVRFWAGTTVLEPTDKQPNIWIKDKDSSYRYYLENIERLKKTVNHGTSK